MPASADTLSHEIRPKAEVVGVILDSYGAYQRQLLEGIREVLEPAGLGILCILGRELSPKGSSYDSAYSGANNIYNIAKSIHTKGFIFASSSLGHTVSSQTLETFIKSFGSVPQVSIGVNIPDVASVTTNNTSGMKALMQHLTNIPNYKRFAFVRGFKNNLDSLDREHIFCQALQDAGLSIDPELMIDGRFFAADAFMAMDTLLEHRQDIDVVVAANDNMALGVINALRKHGLSVPYDVAVTGFDDLPESTTMLPPLTTVRQPMALQGKAAALQLLSLIKTGQAEPILPIHTELVVRRSCGVSLAKIDTKSREARTYKLQEKELIKTLGLPTQSLLKYFLGALKTDGESFLKNWQLHLNQSVSNPHDLMVWQTLLRTLESQIIKHNNSKEELRQRLLLLMQAQRLNAEMAQALQMQNYFEDLKQDEIQGRIRLMFSAHTQLEMLLEMAQNSLLQSGIKRCFIALYQNSDKQAQLKLAFANGHRLHIDPELFAASELLPTMLQGEFTQGTLLLIPIYIGDEQYGYILIDPTGMEDFKYEHLTNSLSIAIRNSIQLASLQTHTTQLEQANQELMQLANYDPLTNLPNRTLFKTQLEQAFSASEAQGKQVTLLFLDLDGFKYINDTFGHSIGDKLISLVAERLKHILRPGDSVARLGGDEFTIILRNVNNPAASVRVSEAILETFKHPFKLLNNLVHVSCSIGISHYPLDGQDAETLIKHADTAMYYAKANGKNCYNFYTHNMGEQALEQLQLEQEIRLGLERQEFLLYYQPRFDLQTQTITSFEALLRWQYGDQMRAPNMFIPLAERTGLIIQLGHFALLEACKQAKLWCEAGQGKRVSVNLSVKQLQQKDIVTEVSQILDQVGLDPQWLELEITESAAMTHVEQNIATLWAFRNMGIHIAIDDFGTAYSSLNYLKRLPVTNLKIDKSFIEDIEQQDGGESADTSIVKAIVALGKSMGFKLVAEGVETTAQHAFLSSVGCDEAQGYLFSRPLSVHNASLLLDLATQPISDVQKTIAIQSLPNLN